MECGFQYQSVAHHAGAYLCLNYVTQSYLLGVLLYTPGWEWRRSDLHKKADESILVNFVMRRLSEEAVETLEVNSC